MSRFLGELSAPAPDAVDTSRETMHAHPVRTATVGRRLDTAEKDRNASTWLN